MQTIYLDISNKGIIPCIQAKQSEVGRKFLAIITDGGVPFNIQNSTQISVWFEGDSGVGNYSDIGDSSVVSVDGNKITVTLIEQMLKNAGDGTLCMLLNDANGIQIGLWNIHYSVQYVPGLGSEKATEYFTAFSESATKLAKSAEEIKEKQERIDYQIKTRNKSAAGLIYPLATKNIPSGFLLCDGSEYLRSEYPELFEAIGTVYGEGDGSTTFNVPNLSTRVPVGTGDGYELGKVGGEENHTLTVDEMPEHTHNVQGYVYGGSSWPEQTFGKNTIVHDVDGGDYHSAGYTTNASSALSGKALATGNNQPYNNMQPYTVVNYIISTGKEIEFVVGGVGDGGAATLFVTFNVESTMPGLVGTANHTSAEIAEHINSGGIAYLCGIGDGWSFTLPIGVYNGIAVAYYVADDGINYSYEVLSDGRVYMYEHWYRGEVSEKQYELIEEITLEEDVSSFKRSEDVDGNPYNLSAIIITVDSPAAASAQVIFKIMDSSKNLVYHQISQALTTSGNMVFCKAYNDRGLVEYHVGSAKLDSASTLSRKPNYVIRSWENVNNFTLSTYSSSTTVPFPAGTKITIYGIRG